MKKILKWIIVIVVIALVSCVSVLYYNNNQLKYEVSALRNNEKAFMEEANSYKKDIREYQLTIDKLNNTNDSIFNKMNDIRKELKIKDKNLKELAYLLSEANKKDTVFLKDTIFKDSDVKIDTTYGDQWCTVRLGLEYPNKITTDLKVKSESYIVTSYRKETVNPPKKCFIGRWFQRKHKIVEVNVIEKNPYIENKSKRFVEIIK